MAEEARNVCVENEQCLYTDEILPQVAGMTRPVVVTIAEYSHSSLNNGATIAPRIFTETLMPVLSAGRCSPVDKMGQAGPGDETDRSVLSGSETEDRRTRTVVDMGVLEPKVMAGDLTHLRDSWPPGIFNHMKWFQQDLELMRKEAKREFTQARPMPCKYCGKVIRCNMYRHVARLHLDLAQLWRCPV